MKNKIFISFILSCILIFINSICFASELKISTDDKLKENININVKVTIDLQEIDEKIYFLQGQLEYDQNIFEKITTEDITLLNDWHGLVFNSENGKFVIEGNNKSENNIEEIMIINLKSKKNIASKKAIIQIKDVKEIGENEVENQLQNSILNLDVIEEDNLANSILPFTGSNSFILYAIIILSLIALTSIILIVKKNNSSR